MKHLYEAANIVQNEGLAEIGKDLFVNTMPHDVKSCVQFKDPVVGANIDEEQEGFTKHYFTIIVRDTDPSEGWERARVISEALRIAYHDSPEVEIRSMYPLKLPSTYHFGEADDMETSVHMRVWFKLK